MSNSSHIYIIWYFVRVSALLIILGFLFDLEILILTKSLFFIHIRTGLESIISDYIHSYVTQLLYMSFIRILVLESLFCLVELLL